jgi:cysteine-rich repeat protein
VKVCPKGYVGDDESGLCVYEPPKDVSAPFARENCTWHQYFNEYNETCDECHSSCQTCYGQYETDCFTCPRGRYLWIKETSSLDRFCLPCHPSAMFYGPAGDCLERCGDGLNFGINECDDGNLDSGDGCSPECQIEEGWICSEGSRTKKDSCFPIRT